MTLGLQIVYLETKAYVDGTSQFLDTEIVPRAPTRISVNSQGLAFVLVYTLVEESVTMRCKKGGKWKGRRN